MNRYALIENNIAVSIVVSDTDPSYMTDLLCVEVDNTVEVGDIYEDGEFTHPLIDEDAQS
jgi:hypothetical protein